MKIPKSIRIAGVEYTIIDNVPSLNDGHTLSHGIIDYYDHTIQLSDLSQSHQMKCLTLWHEILHGIRNNNGMEIENEEAVVDMFAKGLYQVLQDNGGRLFDLKETSSE